MEGKPFSCGSHVLVNSFLGRLLAWSTKRSWSPSFDEFLDELSLLGIRGRVFGPQEYAEALETYLDLTIDFTVVRASKRPDVHRSLVQAGRVAALQYFRDSGRARIWLPDTVSPVSLSAAVYHELSHIAAGHPLQTVLSNEVNSDTCVSHTRRLARREPVEDPRLQDREADLRAQYAFAAGIMGAGAQSVAGTA